jgi:uncharacterized protein YbjT (DUF2867 family)
MSEAILVTGAAGGSQGSTGFRVTQLLREQGHTVRALVHRLDERSDRVRGLGAEVVEADLHDLQSISEAMAGIRRAYFVFPVEEGLLQAAATFAAATRAAGVEQVVNLSQWLQPDGPQPTPHQTRHWLVEQIFDWAGVGAVHLDATVFYENLGLWAQLSLRRTGAIAMPWGPEQTKIPLIAAEDVAAVAAAVLSGPLLPGGTVIRLMGGGISCGEIAEAFSQVLGGPMRYVEISDEEWANAAPATGASAIAVEHLVHLWRYLRTRPPEYQAFYQPTDVFDRFLGHGPKSLSQYLNEHRDVFAEAATRS